MENWREGNGGDLVHLPKAPILFAKSRREILHLRHNLTFTNNLTILCTLQHICDSGELSASREYTPLKLISI